MRTCISVIVVCVLCCGVYGKDCVSAGPCSCTFDDGSGTIDVSGIGLPNGGSLIQDVFANDGFAYSYNPCYGFTEGTCFNAAACQFDSANVVYYNIGDSAQPTWSYDGLNVIVQYTSDDGVRFSKVTLICDESATVPQTQVQGEGSQSNYDFTVTTNAACTDAPPPVSPTPGGGGKVEISVSISTGTVMCIIFFTVVPVYLLAGVLFNRFARHRSGTELVPNATIWVAIPGLIKEGFRFSISLCGRRSGYQKA